MKTILQIVAVWFCFITVTLAASKIINGGFPLPPPIPKGSPIAGHPSYPSAAGNPRIRVQYIWTGNDQWTVYYHNQAGTLKIIKKVDGGTAWSYVTGALKLPQ